MTTPNQSGIQEAIRASTGTTLDYNGDWSALFDSAGIATGDWNGRLLAWINVQLSANYVDLPGAMQAYAANAGFTHWSAINTLTLGGGGGGHAASIVLEDGTSYLLLEDGSSSLLLE